MEHCALDGVLRRCCPAHASVARQFDAELRFRRDARAARGGRIGIGGGAGSVVAADASAVHDTSVLPGRPRSRQASQHPEKQNATAKDKQTCTTRQTAGQHTLLLHVPLPPFLLPFLLPWLVLVRVLLSAWTGARDGGGRACW